MNKKNYNPIGDGVFRPEICEDTGVIEFLKEQKPGLEKVDYLTICIFDKDGKLLASQPISAFMGKRINSYEKEVEEVIPELLLPFLQTFVE
ncbi:MAG: hypothetical protein ACRC2T_00420 [Thermoguttaceae bacterium]